MGAAARSDNRRAARRRSAGEVQNVRKLLLVLVCVLWGCGETDILKQDLRGIDEVEKAKLITQLVRRCQQGVDEAQALRVEETRDAAKAADERVEVGLGRIRILEEALAYGRRAFGIAQQSSEQATYWYALCASYLGWEYDFVGQAQIRKGKEQGDQALVKAGEGSREKAKDALGDGIKGLKYYVREHFDRTRNLQIYMWLAIDYEMAGDLPSAYLVTYDLIRRLEGLKRGGTDAADVDRVIGEQRKAMKKLEEKMRELLISIPALPKEGGAAAAAAR